MLLAEGRPIAWLAVAYLLMSGGEQTALGDLSWIVNRGFPTAGAVLLLVLALMRGPVSGDLKGEVSSAPPRLAHDEPGAPG
jgi:hypothetical protein